MHAADLHARSFLLSNARDILVDTACFGMLMTFELMHMPHGLRPVKLESTKNCVIKLKNKLDKMPPWVAHRTVVALHLYT